MGSAMEELYKAQAVHASTALNSAEKASSTDNNYLVHHTQPFRKAQIAFQTVSQILLN